MPNRIPDIFKRFFTSRTFLLPVGTILGMFVLVNYVILPLYVRHGGTIVVPDVMNISGTSADSILATYNLIAVHSDTRPDASVPLGTVLNQNPTAGSTVKFGRRIYLTVSGGEIEVVVPSLKGRTQRDAVFSLGRAGLKLGTTSHAQSTIFPENTIVEQSIAPNTHVPKGTIVGIVISTGAEAEYIPVPALIGKSTTEAEQILTKIGLKVGNISLQPSFELLPNTVVDQYPRQGERAAKGQAIDLFVVTSGRPSEEGTTPH
jgi:serine/threonine-protein kinase